MTEPPPAEHLSPSQQPIRAPWPSKKIWTKDDCEEALGSIPAASRSPSPPRGRNSSVPLRDILKQPLFLTDITLAERLLGALHRMTRDKDSRSSGTGYRSGALPGRATEAWRPTKAWGKGKGGGYGRLGTSSPTMGPRKDQLPRKDPSDDTFPGSGTPFNRNTPGQALDTKPIGGVFATANEVVSWGVEILRKYSGEQKVEQSTLQLLTKVIASARIVFPEIFDVLADICSAPRDRPLTTYRYVLQVADGALNCFRDQPPAVSSQIAKMIGCGFHALQDYALTRNHASQSVLARHAKLMIRYLTHLLPFCPDYLKTNAVDFIAMLGPFCVFGVHYARMYSGKIKIDDNAPVSGYSSFSDTNDSADSDPLRGSKTKTMLFENVRHASLTCVKVIFGQVADEYFGRWPILLGSSAGKFDTTNAPLLLLCARYDPCIKVKIEAMSALIGLLNTDQLRQFPVAMESGAEAGIERESKFAPRSSTAVIPRNETMASIIRQLHQALCLLIGSPGLNGDDMYSSMHLYTKLIPQIPYTMLQPGLITEILHCVVPFIRPRDAINALGVVTLILNHSCDALEIKTALEEQCPQIDDSIGAFVFKYIVDVCITGCSEGHSDRVDVFAIITRLIKRHLALVSHNQELLEKLQYLVTFLLSRADSNNRVKGLRLIHEWFRQRPRFVLGEDLEPPAVVSEWNRTTVQTVIGLWKDNDAESKHAVSCLTHMFDRSDDTPPRIDIQLFQHHAPELLPRMLAAVAPGNNFDVSQRAAIFTALGTFAQHRFGNADEIELQLMDVVLGALEDASSEVRAVVLPAMGNCAAIYWNLIERPPALNAFFEKALGTLFIVISNQNPLFMSSSKSMSDALRAFGHLLRLVRTVSNAKNANGEPLDLIVLTDSLLGRFSNLDNAVKQRCAANAAFALGSIYDSPRDLDGFLSTHVRVMKELGSTVVEADFARLRVSALSALAHAPLSVWQRIGQEERLQAWRNLVQASKSPLKERKGKFKQVSADQVAQFNRSFSSWMYNLLNAIKKDDASEIAQVLTILDEGCSSLGVILCLAGPESVQPLLCWLRPETTSSLPPGLDAETVSHSEDTKSTREGIAAVLERMQASESFNASGKLSLGSLGNSGKLKLDA